jgi:hypothetical protein
MEERVVLVNEDIDMWAVGVALESQQSRQRTIGEATTSSPDTQSTCDVFDVMDIWPQADPTLRVSTNG